MINLEHLIAFGSTVALSGLVLSAQAPTQSQPPKPALGAVTLTGCIKPWEGSTMGTPPAATTTGSAAAREYVLTGAEPSAAPEKTATADAQAHSTYLLKTAPPVDLAQHVNHKVEVAGTLVKAPTPATPDPERGDSTLKSAATPVAVTVVSLKMISTSCP